MVSLVSVNKTYLFEVKVKDRLWGYVEVSVPSRKIRVRTGHWVFNRWANENSVLNTPDETALIQHFKQMRGLEGLT